MWTFVYDKLLWFMCIMPSANVKSTNTCNRLLCCSIVEVLYGPGRSIVSSFCVALSVLYAYRHYGFSSLLLFSLLNVLIAALTLIALSICLPAYLILACHTLLHELKPFPIMFGTDLIGYKPLHTNLLLTDFFYTHIYG